MIATLRNIFGPRRAVPGPVTMVPPGQRAYAIGDIHGRADLFEAMIFAIEDDDRRRGALRGGTQVVLLGDLVDRGPDSAGVLRLARDWQGRRAVRIIAGNHEEMLLASLDDTEALRHLLRFGGRETVLSFGMDAETYERSDYEAVQAVLRAALEPEWKDYIAGFETQVRIGDYLFVHAGINPHVPIDAQQPGETRWIREPFLSWDGDYGATVVHGHTITELPEFAGNRIGIDTGAYQSGRLTALGLEGTQRWLVSVVAEPSGAIAITREPVPA